MIGDIGHLTFCYIWIQLKRCGLVFCCNWHSNHNDNTPNICCPYYSQKYTRFDNETICLNFNIISSIVLGTAFVYI